MPARRNATTMAKKTRKSKVAKKPTRKSKKLKKKATRRAATKANSLFSPKLPFRKGSNAPEPLKGAAPRDVNATRSGFQSNLSIGILLSVPVPSSEACWAKGNPMRTITQPPPSCHCDQCGGELRLKLIEPANRTLDLENEIFVCANCGRERSCTVSHNHNAGMPAPQAA